MSLTAHNWARDLSTLKSSTLKAILKELANFENGQGIAWCDIGTLVRFTDLNRKTVIAGLQELVTRGVLVDTGERAGSSKRSPIYRLVGLVPDFVRTQQIEGASAGEQVDGPKNGTISDEGANPTQGDSQPIENTGAIPPNSNDSHAPERSSQKRDDPKNGMIPITAGDSPVFGQRSSQKRDTNSENGINRSDARASAGGRARASQPESKPVVPLSPDEVTRYWRGSVPAAFEADLWNLLYLDLPSIQRRPMTDWPPRLRDMTRIAVDRVVTQMVESELAFGIRTKSHQDMVGTLVAGECEKIVGSWRGMTAAQVA